MFNNIPESIASGHMDFTIAPHMVEDEKSEFPSGDEDDFGELPEYSSWHFYYNFPYKNL